MKWQLEEGTTGETCPWRVVTPGRHERFEASAELRTFLCFSPLFSAGAILARMLAVGLEERTPSSPLPVVKVRAYEFLDILSLKPQITTPQNWWTVTRSCHGPDALKWEGLSENVSFLRGLQRFGCASDNVGRKSMRGVVWMDSLHISFISAWILRN